MKTMRSFQDEEMKFIYMEKTRLRFRQVKKVQGKAK